MIGILVALEAEAKPLIERYRLQPEKGVHPRLFRRGEITLVVSGMGRERAAAGTEALVGQLGSHPQMALLNVGLAGHRSRALGESLVASSVEEARSGRVWELAVPDGCSLPQAKLRTVDSPELGYGDEVLYDMEASAVVGVALRSLSPSAVQVVKVVSDNRVNPVSGVTRALVGSLMTGALPAIDEVIAILRRDPQERRRST